MLSQTNRGFDGLERLTQWRNAQWQQSNQFEILRIGIAGIRQTYRQGDNNAPPPSGYIPSNDTFRVDNFGTLDTIGFEFFFLGMADFQLSRQTKAQFKVEELGECTRSLFGAVLDKDSRDGFEDFKEKDKNYSEIKLTAGKKNITDITDLNNGTGFLDSLTGNESRESITFGAASPKDVKKVRGTNNYIGLNYVSLEKVYDYTPDILRRSSYSGHKTLCSPCQHAN